MEIVKKKVSELTDREYRQCRRLTTYYDKDVGAFYHDDDGDEGNMYSMLPLFRQHSDAHVIMLRSGPKLHGWALLVPTKALDYDGYGVTDHGKRNSRYVVQIIVRKSQRGKGLGTWLMRECLKYDRKPFVYAYSPVSGAFYKNFPVTTEREYRNEFMKR